LPAIVACFPNDNQAARFLLALFKEQTERQRAERAAAKGMWAETGFVFTTPVGTPCDERRVRQALDAIVTEPKIAPKQLLALRDATVRHQIDASAA
jgi:hypothetical protein